LTVDPEAANGPFESMTLRQFMKGKADHICMVQFKNGTYSLAKRFFENVALAELTIPELIEFVKEEIRTLERKILPIAVDRGPQVIQRRSREKPPKPQ
jgi:hypothetical protein